MQVIVGVALVATPCGINKHQSRIASYVTAWVAVTMEGGHGGLASTVLLQLGRRIL
jgi:hypothetical protein